MNIVSRVNDPVLKEQLKPQGNDGGNTAQGLYIVAADGKFYGFVNEHPDYYNQYDTGFLKRFLQKGLDEFKKNPPSLVQIQPEGSASVVPNSATVVRVFTRIVPPPAGSDSLNQGLGRDHLWILPQEIDQISSATNDGRTFALPSSLVARLVRYHLVDNVRGEPDMWKKNEIKHADFQARLVSSNQARKTYDLNGAFALATADGRRGFSGTMQGLLQVPTGGDKRQVHFRAIAHGQAWGAGKFTPRPPSGRFPLTIAMVETNDETSRIVPPEAFGESWADDYLNPN